MAKEFKAFLLRGNVVDLAVGIVIGAAFGALVTALVRDLLTPIVAAVFFFVVKPVNTLMARRKTSVDVESETRPCSECLSEIPREAHKCAFCASPQRPIAA